MPKKTNPHRTGPRPLPLHLLTQLLTIRSLQSVLPIWKNDSVVWKKHLQQEALDLLESIKKVPQNQFHQAINTEYLNRMNDFIRGVDLYQNHPYRRKVSSKPIVWKEGSTELLNYALPHAKGKSILIIPSLVNRSYILDLSHKNSFVRYLAKKGWRPYLLDWGTPNHEEMAFSLENYIGDRLEKALTFINKKEGKPFILGYCMGGLLALALSTLYQERILGLSLMATPWNFHRHHHHFEQNIPLTPDIIKNIIQWRGYLPADILQILFFSNNPTVTDRKFRAFSHFYQNKEEAEHFVAVEDWVNDSIPLAGPVACECLVEWYGENRPYRGEWKICGEFIRPENLSLPSLLLIPEHDKIVTAESAQPLALKIPHADFFMIPTGHVSMIVGPNATDYVFQKTHDWMKQKQAES